MSTPTEDLATAEAQLDHMGRELDRLRAILKRLGCVKPGEPITSPSHVTRAQAARILGLGMNGIIYRVRTKKLRQELHWGTQMIPVADVVRMLNEDEAPR